MLSKTYHKVPHPHLFLNISNDGDSTGSLGSLFQSLITLFSEEIFPYVQPELTLVQLGAISPYPITSCLGEEADPHLDTTTFQEDVEGNKFIITISFS